MPRQEFFFDRPVTVEEIQGYLRDLPQRAIIYLRYRDAEKEYGLLVCDRANGEQLLFVQLHGR